MLSNVLFLTVTLVEMLFVPSLMGFIHNNHKNVSFVGRNANRQTEQMTVRRLKRYPSRKFTYNYRPTLHFTSIQSNISTFQSFVLV